MSVTHPSWTEIPIHVVDFEGSGRTGVVESGVATLLGGEIISTRTSLHAARGAVPSIDTQCHGLSQRDLAGATPFEAEWDRWVILRRTGVLAAHNATVEAGLLRATWPRPSVVPSFVGDPVAVAEWGPWIDTCRLARAWVPTLGEYGLSSLVSALRLEPRLDALATQHCPSGRRRYHCALYDALAAALILRVLGGLEGRSLAPTSHLVRDSISAQAADDLMQGELGL